MLYTATDFTHYKQIYIFVLVSLKCMYWWAGSKLLKLVEDSETCSLKGKLYVDKRVQCSDSDWKTKKTKHVVLRGTVSSMTFCLPCAWKRVWHAVSHLNTVAAFDNKEREKMYLNKVFMKFMAFLNFIFTQLPLYRNIYLFVLQIFLLRYFQ